MPSSSAWAPTAIPHPSFRAATGLEAAIDPKAADPIAIIRAPGAPEPRVTLTLPMLADARLLALHIEGEDKMAAYERAVADGPAEAMPVSAVLRAPRDEPVNVFWAP